MGTSNSVRSPAKYSSSCVAVSFSTGGTSSASCAPVAALVRQPEADQHVAVALEHESADRGVEGHGDGGGGWSCCTSFHASWWGSRRGRGRERPQVGHGVAAPRPPALRERRRVGPGRRAGRGHAPPRRMPRSVGMNASGSRSARMATYSAVHGPMPGSATSERRSSRGIGAGVDDDVAALDGLGQRHERPAAAGRHGERARLVRRELDERRGRREEVGDGCRRARGARHRQPGPAVPPRCGRPPPRPAGRSRRGPPARSRRPSRARAVPDRAGDRRPRSRSAPNASQTATGSASRSSSWRQRATAVVRSRRSERSSSPSTKAGPLCASATVVGLGRAA